MNSGVIKKIYRAKDIENIQNKINMLGSNRKFKFDAVTFLNIRIITTILLTLILSIAGQVGDLIFSTIKRYYKINYEKDLI